MDADFGLLQSQEIRFPLNSIAMSRVSIQNSSALKSRCYLNPPEHSVVRNVENYNFIYSYGVLINQAISSPEVQRNFYKYKQFTEHLAHATGLPSSPETVLILRNDIQVQVKIT